jgi:hypothetical protein
MNWAVEGRSHVDTLVELESRLFCRKCDALLAAEFHGIQDLLEAGMLADVGQQRIDAQPSGSIVAFAHGMVEPLDGLVGSPRTAYTSAASSAANGCRSAYFG